MSARERPLSPHLQIYRPQLTSVLSILHRAAGVFLSLAAFGLSGALVLLAYRTNAETYFARFYSSGGQVVLFLFSAALVYHFLNGIRHLLWDTGRGLDIPHVYATGWAVVALTVVITSGLWWLV